VISLLPDQTKTVTVTNPADFITEFQYIAEAADAARQGSQAKTAIAVESLKADEKINFMNPLLWDSAEVIQKGNGEFLSARVFYSSDKIVVMIGLRSRGGRFDSVIQTRKKRDDDGGPLTSWEPF
jgi:hypothetical protein